MPPRLLLVLVAAVSVVLLVAIGASYPGDGCTERVWSAALDGLTDRQPEPCAAQAMDRVYAVAAGLMGLVLASTLITRRG